VGGNPEHSGEDGHAGRGGLPNEGHLRRGQALSLVDEVAEGALQDQGFGGERFSISAFQLSALPPRVGVQLGQGEEPVVGLFDTVFHSELVRQGTGLAWAASLDAQPRYGEHNR
jgi:hypothetical protein